MANEFLSPVGDLETYFVDEYTLIDQFVGDQLWVWGLNNDLQLGIGSNNVNDFRVNPTIIDSGSNNWLKISVGTDFIGAIKSDGTLWVWGTNSDGQLGTNDTSDKSLPTQIGTADYWIDVKCGGAFLLALKDDGTMWSCGRNVEGQLGIGNNTNIVSALTKIGTNSDWISISAGGDHSCAIKNDGTLWSWGNNIFGKLGLGVGIASTNVPTKVGTDTNWKIVSAGNNMTSSIKKDGTLWVWGNNEGVVVDGVLTGFGQLGLGDTISRYVPTKLGSSNDWKYVNSGRFSAAIKNDGTLWAWGRNTHGQLGRGYFTTDDSTDSRVWSPEQVGIGSNWKTVSCGHHSMLAIKTDGTMWACGRNNSYQLANSSTTQSIPYLIQINKGSQNWKSAITRLNVSIALSVGINPVVP